MTFVRHQGQIVEPVIGFVTVEVVDVESAWNWSEGSDPDCAVFQVAAPVQQSNANVALPERTLSALPVPVVFGGWVAKPGAAVSAEARVDPMAFRSLVALGGRAAIAARNTRLDESWHLEMVA